MNDDRRKSLLGLKSELEEAEAKIRVCYLEVVQMLCEEEKEGGKCEWCKAMGDGDEE